jgi:hypothetical protein
VAITPLDGGNFRVVQIAGTPNRKAEELLSYQLGYRAEVTKQLSFDLATLNFYHHLQTNEPGPVQIQFFRLAESWPPLSSRRAHCPRMKCFPKLPRIKRMGLRTDRVEVLDGPLSSALERRIHSRKFSNSSVAANCG